MTLLERIQHLRTAAAAADDAHAIKQRTGALVTAAETVESLLKDVRQVAGGMAELRAVGISPSRDLPDAATDKVTSLLRETAASLAAQDVDAPLDGVKAHIKQARALIDGLRQAVDGAWAKELSRDTPPINEDLVNALAKSGLDIEQLRAEIENAHGILNVLRNRAVPQVGDVAKLASARESLRSCGERISRLVDPTLARVIMEAQEATGMPLSSITPEVLTQLARLGILDRFWVRLR
ncbi:hypothetical protein JK361_33200 [Streptomyces sp. 5-8]|uniref:Uncharacterized protein n=1 Tax=Streptomyces musisoli TaxID=2802280 RepID=A0ABS1PAJ9_9ACTN|nr:hypothetical protein [Streptomyces musisoli]MBL1109383.1 hypothetical protein [Streptomyces musisoli]